MKTNFTIIAGKQDGDSVNIKYIETFDTFEEAISVADNNSGYPHITIECRYGQYVWEINYHDSRYSPR